MIENRPGGRGASQMVELTRAAPDGYTIGAVTNTHLAAFNQTLKQYNVGQPHLDRQAGLRAFRFCRAQRQHIKDMQGLLKAIKDAAGQDRHRRVSARLRPAISPGKC